MLRRGSPQERYRQKRKRKFSFQCKRKKREEVTERLSSDAGFELLVAGTGRFPFVRFESRYHDQCEARLFLIQTRKQWAGLLSKEVRANR